MPRLELSAPHVVHDRNLRQSCHRFPHCHRHSPSSRSVPRWVGRVLCLGQLETLRRLETRKVEYVGQMLAIIPIIGKPALSLPALSSERQEHTSSWLPPTLGLSHEPHSMVRRHRLSRPRMSHADHVAADLPSRSPRPRPTLPWPPAGRGGQPGQGSHPSPML